MLPPSRPFLGLLMKAQMATMGLMATGYLAPHFGRSAVRRSATESQKQTCPSATETSNLGSPAE